MIKLETFKRAIEGTVENRYAKHEDKADFYIPEGTAQIYDFIAAYLDRPKDNDVEINRASAATMCYKRRWFQGKGTEGTPLTPRKLVNFLLGDLSERVLVYFVSEACVGPGKLYSEVDFGKVVGSIHFQNKELKIYQQDELVTDVGGIKVKGHPDGWGKRNSDGKWEQIEFKSAADYGFDKFKENGPDDYLNQSHVILKSDKAQALGVTETRFFYLKKNTGHVWDRLFKFDPMRWEKVIEEYRLASQAEEPPTPHAPVKEMTGRAPNKKWTGRMIAAFPCTYCPFIGRCLGPHLVEWKLDYQSGCYKPLLVFQKEEKDENNEGADHQGSANGSESQSG